MIYVNVKDRFTGWVIIQMTANTLESAEAYAADKRSEGWDTEVFTCDPDRERTVYPPFSLKG